MANPSNEQEILELRQRLKVAEVVMMMFIAKKPRVDPRKMVQAYLQTYPEPIATELSIEAVVAAKESGEAKAAGRRNN